MIKNVFEENSDQVEEQKPIENVPWTEKHDQAKILGEDVTSYSYHKVPVSEFGMKMLQRMGFQEGGCVGINKQNALEKPIEFLSRSNRLGLGAKEIQLQKTKILNKQLEKANGQQGQVTITFSFYQQVSITGKAYKSLDEKSVNRNELLGINVNSEVVILKKKYLKFIGVVLNVDQEKETYLVQLKLNDENIKLKEGELMLKKEYDKMKQQNFLQNDEEGKELMKQEKKNEDSEEGEKKKKLKWVCAGLIAKIRNKNYRNGKFYHKKIRIHDILNKYSFTALYNDEYLEDLCEKDLKPWVPDVGSKVKIIKGKSKGMVGSLESIEKKLKRCVVDGEVFEIEEICGI